MAQPGNGKYQRVSGRSNGTSRTNGKTRGKTAVQGAATGENGGRLQAGQVRPKKSPSEKQNHNGSRRGKPERSHLQRTTVPCLQCGLCCSYVSVEIDEPSTLRRATEILWHLYHKGVSIYHDGDEWLVQFEARCQHHGDDNRCRIYQKRPYICRELPQDCCEVNARQQGEYFLTPGQFLDFLQHHRKRIYAAMQQHGFIPPPATRDGQPAARKHIPPFQNRLRRLRSATMSL